MRKLIGMTIYEIQIRMVRMDSPQVPKSPNLPFVANICRFQITSLLTSL
jgi:hypothetical protein